MTEKNNTPSLLSSPSATPPKPEVDIKVESTQIEGTNEQHNKLREIGQRLKPDQADLRYAASFCVHIYGQDIGMGFATIVQQCWDEVPPPIVANKAVQELSIAVAKRYGWEPGKHQRSKRKEVSK